MKAHQDPYMHPVTLCLSSLTGIIGILTGLAVLFDWRLP
jgi:hypothetical protein